MVIMQFPSAAGEKPKLQESQTNTRPVGSGEAWQYDNLTANASISPKLCYAFGTLYAVWADGSALWFAKSRDAGQSWGKRVIYQLFNEENHPVNTFLRDQDEVTGFEVGYEGLVEGGETSFETIVNAFADWPLWADRMNVWATSSKVHILAIDHYPGTWVHDTESGDDRFKDWGPLDSLFNIANSHGKKCAIMETGFSTWASEGTQSWNIPHYWHTEDDQENFINVAFPIIKEKVLEQNFNNPSNEMVIACWYELVGSWDYVPWWWPVTDPPIDAYWWVEDNFGILKDDWSMKRGYDDLQRQIFSIA
ncbi:MAG: hypothetical protein QXU48_00380 [Thermoplasmata archaeon]